MRDGCCSGTSARSGRWGARFSPTLTRGWQTQASTLVDLGGYYYIRNPGLQILFAYGHSVFGQTENYAYLGLYQTWGKNKGGAKDSSNNGENGGHGLLSRMLVGR